MSLRATIWAWRVPGLSPTQRLVLLRLADQTNDDGECYPSQGSLATWTGLDRSTVSRALKEMRSHNLLAWKSRHTDARQTSNLYTLAVTDSTTDPVDLCNRGGCTVQQGGGHSATRIY